MSPLHVLILSIVEGLTEFLPISSTGHLILASKLLGIAETDFAKTFEIVIQLGAILAVVVLYTRKFFNIKLIKKLIVAFIPTGIVGVILYPFIKGFLLGSSWVTLNALFWGGAALIIIELIFNRKNKGKEIDNKIDYEKITYKKAFLIGCFQCLSVIPGMSRAAATIIGGLSVGLNRPTATEFSFLLAVPTMVAASGYDLYKSREFISQGGFLTLTIGTILSFVFAMIAIKFLIGYVKKHDFKSFGIYRIILSILYYLFVK
jgi:undecaprenyl-diphosphatase